jgi:hypothetical protein
VKKEDVRKSLYPLTGNKTGIPIERPVRADKEEFAFFAENLSE